MIRTGEAFGVLNQYGDSAADCKFFRIDDALQRKLFQLIAGQVTIHLNPRLAIENIHDHLRATIGGSRPIQAHFSVGRECIRRIDFKKLVRQCGVGGNFHAQPIQAG